ncbi:MAG: DUF1648 domain-containing protein [Clostridia bacterium]
MKIEKKKLIVGILLFLVPLILVIIGFIVLPDKLIVQINFSGNPGNMMPKVLGLILPMVISSLFAFLYISSDERKINNIVFSLLGTLLLVLIFIFNIR